MSSLKSMNRVLQVVEEIVEQMPGEYEIRGEVIWTKRAGWRAANVRPVCLNDPDCLDIPYWLWMA